MLGMFSDKWPDDRTLYTMPMPNETPGNTGVCLYSPYIILYEIEDTIQRDVEHKTAFYNDKVFDDQRTPWAKEEECQTHHQQLHLTPSNLKPQTSKFHFFLYLLPREAQLDNSSRKICIFTKS